MKLTAKIRLNVNSSQKASLLNTLETANACANWLSHQAWKRKVFAQFSLHRLLYREARERFSLSAQIVVRVFAKVADAYKLDKKNERRFARHGAIAYDSRILSFRKNDTVSIWTTDGRQTIPYSAGERQKELLKSQQGESDLIYHRGKFYIAATCNVDDPDPIAVDDFLGIDFGVAKIATSSDGKAYSGTKINNIRRRRQKLRRELQSCGSRSAHRHLQRLSGKESRFAADTNHVISKQIVASAKGTGCGIAIENLTGVRDRITAGRKQRALLHSWAFAQLRAFLEYKARMAWVPLVAVDPRNTSRECSRCHHTEKANRPSQSKFRCRSCGYMANADLNAAQNIRARATRQLANRSELSSATSPAL